MTLDLQSTGNVKKKKNYLKVKQNFEICHADNDTPNDSDQSNMFQNAHVVLNHSPPFILFKKVY